MMIQLQARLMDLTADPSLRAIVITGQDLHSAPEATWT
jgi:hypothetical protein